jgi:Domain of unknown function (DUF4189)
VKVLRRFRVPVFNPSGTVSRLARLPLRSRFGLAVVGALLLSLLPATAHARSQDFGAITISPDSKIVGSALGEQQAEAVSASLLRCQANGGKDCRAVLWFQHSWGALAVANNGYYGSGWGATSDEADGEAKRVCQEWGGTKCEVVHDLSTSSVSDSGAGGEPPYNCNKPPEDPLPELKQVGIDRVLRASTWQTICNTFPPPSISGLTPNEFFRKEILPVIPRQVTCDTVYAIIAKTAEVKIPGAGVELSRVIRAVGSSIC